MNQWRFLLVLVSATVLAACGVTVDQQARTVPVEVGLEYAVTPIPTVPSGITEPATGSIYLFDKQTSRLLGVRRSFETTRPRISTDVPSDEEDALAKGLVEQLFEGPTPREMNEGLETRWPSDLTVLDVDITVVGTAVVEVTSDSRFDDAPLADRKIATAELVYTLTELDQVTAVSLKSEDNDIRLVTDRGVMRPLTPVSRDDFRGLEPEEESE